MFSDPVTDHATPIMYIMSLSDLSGPGSFGCTGLGFDLQRLRDSPQALANTSPPELQQRHSLHRCPC